jgi:hypothetical protein
MNSEPGQGSNISMTKMRRSGWTIHENGLSTNMYRISRGGFSDVLMCGVRQPTAKAASTDPRVVAVRLMGNHGH